MAALLVSLRLNARQEGGAGMGKQGMAREGGGRHGGVDIWRRQCARRVAVRVEASHGRVAGVGKELIELRGGGAGWGVAGGGRGVAGDTWRDTERVDAGGERCQGRADSGIEP